jgi:hypothetical protein
MSYKQGIEIVNNDYHNKGQKMTETKKQILGIIFIGAGSSWYVDKDESTASKKCAKMCKQDWGHLFKFKRRQDFKVNLFDVTGKDWTALYNGYVKDEKDNNIPLLKIETVVV